MGQADLTIRKRDGFSLRHHALQKVVRASTLQPYQMEIGIRKPDLQKLWVYGTLERLSSLGFLMDVPYTVSPNVIELYLHLSPDKLFNSDEELREFVVDVICDDPETSPPDDHVEEISNLVVEYKDNPTRLVKMGVEMSSQFQSE
jgi:hypothetical protein